MAHKTKAERSFEEKVSAGIADRDFPAVEKAYGQYGTYLELVGMDEPVGEARTFQYPAPKPVSLVKEPEPEPEPAA